jgi:hypothetical protein
MRKLRRRRARRTTQANRLRWDIDWWAKLPSDPDCPF